MYNLEKELPVRLLEESLISKEALSKIENECGSLGIPFSSYIVNNKTIPDEKLLPIVAEILGLSYVNLKETPIDNKAIKAVPVKFAWYYEFIPIQLEGSRLTIAVSWPLSVRVQDEIRLSLEYNISTVLAKKDHIVEMLKIHYGLGSDTVDKMVQHTEGLAETIEAKVHGEYASIEDLEKIGEGASVIKLVNQIVLDAYKKRATDIHIEPFRDKIRLRYRIDGVLRDQKIPENLRHFLLPILSRLKIMSGLDISERRIPQDGKTTVKTQEQVLDLRLSFIPTPYGESVVIRILPRKVFYKLENLGFSNEDQKTIESLVKKPNGILFVVGPTGSGKTTTLYSCLEKINKIEKKVVTIEDPIEYEIENVTQIQVNPDAGLTFAVGLRSMLRHDPDIVMVGEVRDRETAEIAIRVALTGHLVLSTVHTNDAATGATRLIEIGIEPYLVASSAEAFIAQRLVRVICPSCKKEYKDIDPEMVKDIASSLSIKDSGKIKIFKGAGCAQCNFTGFYGRVAIYEILLVTQNIKRLIMEKGSALEIKSEAIKNGMKTLLQDGWLKVVNGLTTPEEVLNVCHNSKEDRVLEDNIPSLNVNQENEKELVIKEENLKPGQDERRVHLRVPKRITVRFRLIEKANGEIIKLNKKDSNQKPQDIFLKGLLDDQLVEKVDSSSFVEVLTTTTNISGGGMSFESQYLIPAESILEINFNLPGDNEQIHCLAKVVRVEKDLPKTFYIAVCYLDLSGIMRKKITDFVNSEFSKSKIIKLET